MELTPAERRFWPFVDRKGDCWEWRGFRTSGGYGYFDGTTAHRWSYLFAVGPIPDGLEIDHLCRNRGCVRPEHLEAVTHAENVLRAAQVRTACANGHEFTPETTYFYRGSGKRTASRHCRPCRAEAEARRRAKRKAVA